MTPPPLAPFADRLACPDCRGELALEPEPGCRACGRRFPQPDPSRYLDLWPGAPPDPDPTGWAQRQRMTEESYRELVADPDHAALAWGYDYGAVADLFAALEGPVLDVGGGAGIVRDYLAAGTGYLVVEPSLDWLGDEWSALAGRIPCLGEPLAFVRGMAERLPVADRSFPSVLSIFSLNHVASAAAALDEMRRVVRPGGTLLLVLEDMPPRWGDIVAGAGPARRPAARIAAAARRLAGPHAPHPVQPDHLRLSERTLATHLAPARPDVRRWLADGAYLVLRYRIP